jgi:Do/DeqQ family serine protease
MRTRKKPSRPEVDRLDSRPFRGRALLAAVALFLAFGCAEPSGSANEPRPTSSAAASEGVVRTLVPADAETVRLSFAPLVREVAPAVVSITSSRVARTAQRVDPFFDDPFFRHFFGDLPGPFGRGRPQERRQGSLGSGVIVGGDGLIVTNHHVVEGADEIIVVLADRTEHRAELVASDERSDLAFLRVAANRPLPAVPLGDSDRIEVGDLVLAIGNPFGIGQTVTSGIVSARARSTPGARSDVSFIQTDAAINPGNSGGALVSMDGELIGVNTAIFTRGGGSIGIGFAIPANLVAARIIALEQGLASGRPWLGAAYKPIDTAIALALDLARPQGLLIERVHPRGAAAAAGLRAGDILTAVDGIEVFDAPGLNLRLQLEPLGSSVPVSVLRRGQELTLDLPLQLPPAEPAPDQRRLAGNQPLSGAVVANLSPAFNDTLGIDPFAEGVGIVEIEPRSFATRLRLQPGDVVTAVNGERVASTAALERALGRTLPRWTIGIERNGQVFDLTIG